MSQEKRLLYVGMHDGVCAVRSDDGGASWRPGPVTPLPHAAARLSVCPSHRERAWLAAYEAGVYRTDDGGDSWQRVDSYPSDYAHSVLAHPLEPATVYAGSEPAAIFQSQDGGASWRERPEFRATPGAAEWGFHAPTRDSHVRDLRAMPGDAETLYAGIEVGGVVCSPDGGGSWRPLPGLDADIHCLALCRPAVAGGAARVYAATASAPYRSDDGGAEWRPINDGLARRYTLHIAAAPDDADVMLVTVSENARRKSPQFYRSTDGGASWRLVSGLGSGDDAADMVVAFEWQPGSPNEVYAGVDGGKLYRSVDRGQSWAQLPVELPSVAVGALAVA